MSVKAHWQTDVSPGRQDVRLLYTYTLEAMTDNIEANKKIAESNRIIAEFMGTYTTCDSYGRDIVCIKEAPGQHLASKVKTMKYHTSWDWLMPVWKKATEIGLYMMTHGHERLWLEKEKEIETALIREFDCQKAATLIAALITWYTTTNPVNTNNKND
jgi:hypothetical protein